MTTFRVKPELRRLNFSTRFVQGYRFLDKCGEAIARLESTLDKGWIPAETLPTGGVIRNYALGMTAKFNSEALEVEQTEFIAPEIFLDQTCRIYDTLWRLFEIEAILVPVMRVLVQVGLPDLETSEIYIRKLSFVTPEKAAVNLLGGVESALSFALITEEECQDFGVKSKRRHRLAVNSAKQVSSVATDTNLLLGRMSLLTSRHKEAGRALLELRRKHVSEVVVAVIVDLEQTLESEYMTASFPLNEFVKSRFEFSQRVLKALPTTLET
jgi:hypothetical protein